VFKQKIKKFKDPSKNINCDHFEVDNWEISDFVLSKLVPVVGVRPYPLNELMLMTSVVCRFKPDLLFEWGTHLGKSARIFHETTKAFQLPTKITSIDLPDGADHVEHPHSERGTFVRKIKEVTLLQGDGLAVSLNIYKKFKKNRTVLFFLDGDHSYETVKKELSSIIKNIPSAIILAHDTFLQDEESKYNIGPSLAIEEVLATQKREYQVIKTTTGLPGMTLIFDSTLLSTSEKKKGSDK